MRRLVAAGGLALALLLVGATAADAAQLNGGCSGSATSLDGDGNELDEVSGPGPGGTKSDPFLVDTDGTISYQGSTPAIFHNHKWHVDVLGITVKSGGSKNGSNQSDTSGDVDVDDYVPISAVGLFKASGGIDADEGSCDGSVWVKVVGSPVGTVGWIAGVAASVIGGAGLVSTALQLFKKGGA